MDQKWHALFKGKKPGKILSLEKKLNGLIKEQGKLTTESKEYHQLKKKIMKEIVEGMNGAEGENEKILFKKMEKKRKNIEEINTKIEMYEKRLEQLPQEIEKTNKELVTHTMNMFYLEMLDVRKKAKKHDEKVKNLREIIKEEIIIRDEVKQRSDELYGYIHDVVGSEVIEQYDNYYLKGTEE